MRTVEAIVSTRHVDEGRRLTAQRSYMELLRCRVRRVIERINHFRVERDRRDAAAHVLARSAAMS